MNACGEEGLICIYVANSAEKPLVEKKRLDRTFTLFQSLKESRKVELEGIRSNARDFWRWVGIELYTSELAHIIVNKSSIIKLNHRARILPRRRVPKQIASHSQMNIEETVVKIY